MENMIKKRRNGVGGEEKHSINETRRKLGEKRERERRKKNGE